MESRVIFRDGMDIDPSDFNNLQDFTQNTFDDVIGQLGTTERRFSGFEPTITGVAEVTLQPGLLWAGGRVYKAESAYVKDFTTSLPIATKRIALFVIWGQETDTDTRPREFLIDEETGTSEPRAVAMERARICNLGISLGTESPDPIAPVLDVGVLATVQVVLTPSGVESVTLYAANKLDSVFSVAARVSSLEGFKAVAEPQIVSLASDLSALRTIGMGSISKDEYGRSLARLAVLEAKAGIPVAATSSSADFFLDKSQSDTAHASYLAKVGEGIRFANEASNVTALAVFDALNPRAKIVGGVLFPAYTREARLTVGPRTGELQVTAYSYQTNQLVQRSMARTRLRYGEEYTVCSNSAWWKAGQYDYNTETFTKDGETFEVYNATRSIGEHDFVRVKKFWYDSYEEFYWDNVVVDHSVPGCQVAESFLNANDMWLDAVGLTFTRLAATGAVAVSICELGFNGTPDLTKVISHTSVDRANLSLNTQTVIPIAPVFLTGGTRYAIVVITAADHWLATTAGANFTQGTLFYVLDGAYQQGDATRDLMFTLFACKFAASRAVIEMQPLTLTGGLTAIDILADGVVPRSSSLTWEINTNTGWRPMQPEDPVGLGEGGSPPPLVQLRAVFNGTPDVMPAITLTGSVVRVSRPRLALTHISTVRTLPASSTSIRVIARLEYFESAHHTAVAKLRSGAGYTTVTAASSFADVTNEDGTIERTWLFNLGAGITTYKMQFEATTDSVLNPFHFGWRKDYAL